jgi:hypothetical protein
VALSISVISLLITGLDVSGTAQIAYARAFDMTPLRGVQKYLRGAAWLVLLLADTGAALALRNLASHHSSWFGIMAAAVLLVLEFGLASRMWGSRSARLRVPARYAGLLHA